MKIRGSIQIRQFQDMVKAVRTSEKRIISPGASRLPKYFNYGSSLPAVFMNTITRHPELRPEMTFADLGSGLGLVCFTASFHFKKVLGFELDPALAGAADRIGRELGFTNVSFRQEDFLKADLSACDVLYAYHPFARDFIPRMRTKLEGLASGSYVMANFLHANRQRIFEEGKLFTPIYPEGVSEHNAESQMILVYQKTG